MSTTPYRTTIEHVGAAIRSTFQSVDEWFDKPAALRSHKPSRGGTAMKIARRELWVHWTRI
jgi:hypothetical protein